MREGVLSSVMGNRSGRLKPTACREYLRKQTAEAWAGIVSALVEKATAGSVPHATLLAKLAGFEQRPTASTEPKRRGKSLAQQLREQMEELEARNIAEFGE